MHGIIRGNAGYAVIWPDRDITGVHALLLFAISTCYALTSKELNSHIIYIKKQSRRE
jgi:hypothetical protein